MYAIEYEKKPRYMVFAGLVFQPLDTNLFATAKFEDITVRRLYTDYVPKGLFKKHKDIVVLTRVESDPVTSQLRDFSGFAVDKINGVEVTNLKQAYELLHPKDAPEFFVIELFGASRPVVIPSAAVKEANQRVARNCGIAQMENLSRLTMPRAGIALGSNLGDRLAHLRAAVECLREIAVAWRAGADCPGLSDRAAVLSAGLAGFLQHGDRDRFQWRRV